MTDVIRELKKEVASVCESTETVEFKMLVPSMKHTSASLSNQNKEHFTTSRVALMMEQVKQSFEDFYELDRGPASEAVVFLLCDLDREWTENTARSAPIC